MYKKEKKKNIFITKGDYSHPLHSARYILYKMTIVTRQNFYVNFYTHIWLHFFQCCVYPCLKIYILNFIINFNINN